MCTHVPSDMALKVTHCPVNFAGIPWQNVLALRRKGVDARLVVFNRELRTRRPTGRSTARGFAPAQLTQWRALVGSFRAPTCSTSTSD